MIIIEGVVERVMKTKNGNTIVRLQVQSDDGLVDIVNVFFSGNSVSAVYRRGQVVKVSIRLPTFVYSVEE